MWLLMLIPIAVLVVALTNTGRLLRKWATVWWSQVKRWLFNSIYVVVVLGIVLGFTLFRDPNSAVGRQVVVIFLALLGVLLYLVLFTNLVGLLAWLAQKLIWRQKSQQRQVLKYSGLLAVVITVLVTGYGLIHAQTIEQKDYNVTLTTAQVHAKPLRITLISDLHIGYVTGNQHLARIVKQVNETKPDVILIAGDVFDGNDAALNQPQKTASILRQFKANDGVYASLGNHDSGKDFNLFLQTLAQGNVKLLRDNEQQVADEFILAGRRDSRPIYNDVPKRQMLQTLTRAKNDLPTIVMDHQPSNYHDYDGQTNTLVLSGHTHNGQLWPGNWIVKQMYPAAYGYYRENKKAPQMVVTSGVGTWGPPMRIGSDSEIAVINVNFKQR
ncbi:metallophosphoesterase [Periweissella cryptocerci]|uniref:Metallophosphoesterase n=1 Tax=Periweissella cryptocerci TaxID=2506420 RepID=A0A4V1AIE2_9LACO|nr:metallophosphoesterase [Periweissella cryptocerci]QBO35195.1 metallophosphoesterase [Periweissella cryptocerci]